MLFLWIVLGVLGVCWTIQMFIFVKYGSKKGYSLFEWVFVTVFFLFSSPYFLVDAFLVDRFRKEKKYHTVKELKEINNGV